MLSLFSSADMRSSRGWNRGSRPPMKNNKNIGFLSNTGPDPPEKSQSYEVNNQCWAIIGTEAKRHLNDISLVGQCWPTDSGIWILPLL